MRYWIILCLWVLFSCNDIKECGLSTSTDFAIIAFYEADSTEKYRKDSILVGSVLDPDGYYVPSGGLNRAAYYLDPTADDVAYNLRLNGETYNLYFEYTRSLEIFYDECDPVHTYIIDSVSGPQFDSVALFVRQLDEVVNVNVEIYF